MKANRYSASLRRHIQNLASECDLVVKYGLSKQSASALIAADNAILYKTMALESEENQAYYLDMSEQFAAYAEENGMGYMLEKEV